MVNTKRKGLDIKSLQGYGIHGALGLLMGFGFGYILSFMFGMMFGPLLIFIGYVIVFVIYGAYVGYIFGGEEESSRLAKLGAAAGVFSGLLATGLFAGNLIQRSGIFDQSFIVTLAIVGLIFGLPKIKNMFLLAAFSAFGGAAGYGVYAFGENLTYYLNSIWIQGGLLTIFIMLFFILLAIGIAGASIAIGMHLIERTAYRPREVPWFLKITKSLGIVLAILILFFYSAMFVSIAKYASTSASIHISGSEKITIYVPVLLDESGKLLEMYGKPATVGNVTTTIVDTEYGKALKISGSGLIEINMLQTHGILTKTQEATEKFLDGFTISMSKYTRYRDFRGTVDAWVYSEEDGTELSLLVNRDNGWGRVLSIRLEQPGRLNKGWQAVRLSGEAMWYD